MPEIELDLHFPLVVRQVDRVFQPGRGRDVDEQFVDMVHADDGQHLAPVGVGEGQVAHGAQSPSKNFS